MSRQCCCRECTYCHRVGPTGPTGSSYTFSVAITDGPLGPVLNGPFNITNNKTLSFWSNTLSFSAQPGPNAGDAAVQVESTDTSGGNTGPQGPQGPTGPTGIYDGTISYINWAGFNNNTVPGLSDGSLLPLGWPNLVSGPNIWYEIEPITPTQVNSITIVISNSDVNNSYILSIANVDVSISPSRLVSPPLTTDPPTIIIPAGSRNIITFNYISISTGPQFIIFYTNYGAGTPNSLSLLSLRGF